MNNYWIAFLLTVLTELVVLVAYWKLQVLPKSHGHSLPGRRTPGWLALYVLGINLVTHSFAWASRSYLGVGYWPLEVMVVLAEAIALCHLPSWSFRESLVLSLSMNAASILVGGMVLTV